MATPGYTVGSKTKESGIPKQVIPANTWTLIDLGYFELGSKPAIINAQLYFEEVSTTGHKMVIRVARGSGNDTAQDSFWVVGPTWARSYMDIDYIQVDEDNRRGIEVWSAKGCVVQTRIFKAIRAITYDGALG